MPRLATIRDPSRRFRFDLVEDYHSSRGPPPCIETICKTRGERSRGRNAVEKEEEVNLSTGGVFASRFREDEGLSGFLEVFPDRGHAIARVFFLF